MGYFTIMQITHRRFWMRHPPPFSQALSIGYPFCGEFTHTFRRPSSRGSLCRPLLVRLGYSTSPKTAG